MKKIIYFSKLPDGKDPDDFIKQNGKEGLLSLIKNKEIIQSFIWGNYIKELIKTILMRSQNSRKKLKILHIQ